MGAIELKVTLFAGGLAGLILLFAEMIAMRRKVARYRDHLRRLYQEGRFLRMFSEIAGIFAFALIQPVIAALLMGAALDNFTPQYAAHAVQQLKSGLHHGSFQDGGTPPRQTDAHAH